MKHANGNQDHSYSHVNLFTPVQLAETRDALDVKEVLQAVLDQSSEPTTNRAWRDIIRCHSYIRDQINQIRLARFNQGKRLSVRGLECVNAAKKAGFRMYHNNWAQYEIEQGKLLANNMADLPYRWERLRTMEKNASEIKLDVIPASALISNIEVLETSLRKEADKTKEQLSQINSTITIEYLDDIRAVMRDG